jgi:hypothetical protein
VTFRTGKTIEVVLAALIIGFAYYFIRRAIQGKTEEYRDLPPIAAISDGVDRAVETGQPIFMSMGAYAYLSGLFAAMTISGVNLMRHTFREIIRKGAEPYFMLPINPEVAPLIDGVYRECAVAEGKPEAYNRDRILYFGNDEPAYRSGVLNALATYGPSTYILAGAVTGTGDTIATWASKTLDALLIGGQARITHQAVTIAFDYCLYVSDVYAAGAIVSDDEVMKSTLISADIMTWIAIILAIVSIALSAVGVPIADWLST